MTSDDYFNSLDSYISDDEIENVDEYVLLSSSNIFKHEIKLILLNNYNTENPNLYKIINEYKQYINNIEKIDNQFKIKYSIWNNYRFKILNLAWETVLSLKSTIDNISDKYDNKQFTNELLKFELFNNYINKFNIFCLDINILEDLKYRIDMYYGYNKPLSSIKYIIFMLKQLNILNQNQIDNYKNLYSEILKFDLMKF